MVNKIKVKRNCHNCPNSIPNIDAPNGMHCDWGEDTMQGICSLFGITKVDHYDTMEAEGINEEGDDAE